MDEQKVTPAVDASAAAAQLDGMVQGLSAMRAERMLLGRIRLDADGRNWMLFVRRVGNELTYELRDALGRPQDPFWGARHPPIFANPESDEASLREVLVWFDGLTDRPGLLGVDVAPELTPATEPAGFVEGGYVAPQPTPAPRPAAAQPAAAKKRG